MTVVSVGRRAVRMSACLYTVVLPILPMVSASADAPQLLRVVGTNASASLASVVVAVPPELANRALPGSAFGMRQGGRTLSVTVQRVADAGLDVYVVLDTTAENPAMLAQQSAAADLLRQFPASVRTAVATSNAVPEPQPGIVAALRGLAVVKPRSLMSVDKTLNQIAKAKVDGRRQLIVLLSSCPEDSTTDLGPLRAALDSGTSQLDITGFGSSCRSRLLAWARDSGGLAVVTIAPRQITEAVDTIAYDTLAQYQLSVPASALATQVRVSVDFAGVHSAAEVRLPAAASGSARAPAPTLKSSALAAPTPGAPSSDSGGSRLRAGLVSSGGLILIAAAAAALHSRRDHRRDRPAHRRTGPRRRTTRPTFRPRAGTHRHAR